MSKGLLTEKAREIIREESGLSLRELGAREFNTVRGTKVKYMHVERVRGAIRPSGGLILTPKDIEETREEVAHFRLPIKKTTVLHRILRIFR